MKKKNHVAN